MIDIISLVDKEVLEFLRIRISESLIYHLMITSGIIYL